MLVSCIIPLRHGHSDCDGSCVVTHVRRVQHRALMMEAYSVFAHTNPLHGDIFPSVRRMEAEVVAMTAAMLGGAPSSACS